MGTLCPALRHLLVQAESSSMFDGRINNNMLTDSSVLMPTQYCSLCEEKRACGHHHVYVVELRREVLKEKPDFPFEGEFPADKKAYYVGETAHSPECRFRQHTAKTKDRYLCYCPMGNPSADVPVERTFEPWLKGKYAKSHGFRLEDEEWIRDMNPIFRRDVDPYPGIAQVWKDKASEAEEELGHELRLEGHAVYWGPTSD